ncbi:hypothetical protein DQ354_15920 [Arthrobacter sp. AQ5-06]|nr:hypothetical protein DQ354_15920 [Arthrobacter sp. AQ5-06]
MASHQEAPGWNVPAGRFGFDRLNQSRLARRSLKDPSDLAYFICHTPKNVSLAELARPEIKRLIVLTAWPRDHDPEHVIRCFLWRRKHQHHHHKSRDHTPQTRL